MNSNKKLPLTSSDYCIDIVKKYDYENFLTSWAISHPLIRRISFAVKAFNVEISQIRDLTSNENTARIRLHFWSEAIDNIFGDLKETEFSSAHQPIIRELKLCLSCLDNNLIRSWFKRLIEQRNNALSNFPFTTLKNIEEYSDSCFSPVHYIIFEACVQNGIISASKRINLDHIGSHIGKAQGISNIVRGISFNSRHGRCYVPSDILLKHKVTHQDFLNQKDSQELRQAVFDIASLSYQHLQTARKLGEDKSLKRVWDVFYPIIPVERFLIRLKKYDFNVFNIKLNKRDYSLAFRMLIRYNFKRFMRKI